MDPSFSFEIYTSTAALPAGWQELAACTVFLTPDYLKVLETSAPENMNCFFIGLFCDKQLAGIAVSQYIDLSDVKSFGERDSRFKTKIRKFFFRRLGSHVLFIGNNMLTGQNAFHFNEKMPVPKGLELLNEALSEIKRRLDISGCQTHLIIFKDFSLAEAEHFNSPEFRKYYRFSTQPNMVFDIRKNWLSFENYIGDITKKYRDQYKRSRKKAEGITKRKLHLEEIIQYNPKIYDLYLTVARNAPFNTFYLPEDHFITFKRELKDRFLFYGYFEDEKLIGFNTLIKNGDDIDTYFLGYDESCQREKMLYLNMLYDMIGYSINKGFRKIIFARTALEIKSSVGARPEKMFGFIKHSNALLNALMPRLFRYFEPELAWQERNPFKD